MYACHSHRLPVRLGQSYGQALSSSQKQRSSECRATSADSASTNVTRLLAADQVKFLQADESGQVCTQGPDICQPFHATEVQILQSEERRKRRYIGHLRAPPDMILCASQRGTRRPSCPRPPPGDLRRALVFASARFWSRPHTVEQQSRTQRQAC